MDLIVSLDNLTASFDVATSPHNPPQLLHLTAKLLKPNETPLRDWLPGNVGADRAVFADLDDVGYLCYGFDGKVKIWKRTGCIAPFQLRFDESVTSFCSLKFSVPYNIILVAAGRQVALLYEERLQGGRERLVRASVEGDQLPANITCMVAYNDGKVLIGASDGYVYLLRLSLKQALVQYGFKGKVSSVTGGLMRLIARPTEVSKILLDSDRRLAFVVHHSADIEAIDLTGTRFSDQPTRIAYYFQTDQVQMVSHAVLPLEGFGAAVLVGLSSDGQLFYFYLDNPAFEAGDVLKKAKTYCGIGPNKVLCVSQNTSVVAAEIGDRIAAGCSIRIIGVIKTTLYFAIYDPETDISSLWCLRKASAHYQVFEQIEGVKAPGWIEGLKLSAPLKLSIQALKVYQDDLRMSEVTAQCFYEQPNVRVFTKRQFFDMAHRWPVGLVKFGLETVGIPVLIDAYGAINTAAMMIFLAMNGDRKAYRMLLEERHVADVLDEGFGTLFKWMIDPIWTKEAFRGHNAGSMFATDHVMSVALSPVVLEVFKERAREMDRFVERLFKDAWIDVYASGRLHLHTSSRVNENVAKNLAWIRLVPAKFAESLGLLRQMSSMKRVEVTKSADPSLLREISQMSVRDFLSMVLKGEKKYLDFLKEIRRQIGDHTNEIDELIINATLNLRATPSSDPLADLKTKIRSINEEIGRFSQSDIPDRVERLALLRDHHAPVYDLMRDLNSTAALATNEDLPLAASNLLAFVKAVQELRSKEVKSEVLLEIARENIHHPSIILNDPSFRKVLEVECGAADRVRFFVRLTKRSLKAFALLIKLCCLASDFSSAGALYLALATRRLDKDQDRMTLETCSALLRQARGYYLQCRGDKEAEAMVDFADYLIQTVEIQKEVVVLIKWRFRFHDIDKEDRDLMLMLESTICQREDLKVIVEVLSNENFRQNKNMKTPRELLEMLAN